MEVLSEREIIKRLQRGLRFEAVLDTGAFEIRVNDYVPAVVTALHDGHAIGEDRTDDLLVSDYDRLFEEDPYTGDIAKSFTMSLKVNDSRYYYDLNRRPEQSVYEVAWGKVVWKNPPTPEQQEQSRARHHSYYRVLQALLTKLENLFGRCVVYDLHSYNAGRLIGSPPLFNIGTHFMDVPRYQSVVDNLAELLLQRPLSGCETRVALNEIFAGRGYQAEFIAAKHPENLCIPLELKKVFMDEQSLELKRDVFAELRASLARAVSENASFFSRGLVNSFAPARFISAEPAV